MAKLNTHGLTMKGIRKAAGETRGLPRNGYVQVFYNEEDGEVWTEFFCDLGQNWSAYPHDGSICIGNYAEPTTMQNIADDIHRTVQNKGMYW